MISLLRCFICPLDTSAADPIFGKIVEEDAETGIFLVANFTITNEFQGYIIMSFREMMNYRIFKGKEEAQAYVQANFIP